MTLLADENIDRDIVDGLRLEGYNTLYVAEMDPGISDDEVLNLANKEDAILLTFDKDFGELVFRRGSVNNGVILIRLEGLPQLQKVDIVKKALNEHIESMINAFSVITPGTIRIRKK